MEFYDFITLVKDKRKTVYGIIALFLLVAVVIIAVQPFKYSSKSQLLVVQEYNGPVDAYTASKSSEYLSTVLSSVIKSNSFYTKVMEASFDVNANYFGATTKKQMKMWGKTVVAKNVSDSGIIAVTVYHPDPVQADKIVRGINHVLMTQHTAYHGSGDAVKIRLIDQPVTSTFPVKPNIPLIGGGALALGFIASLLYIYLLPESAATQQANRKPKFEEVMVAHSYYPIAESVPNYQSTKHEVRGQLPEEAVNNLDHAHAATAQEINQGGYLEDDELKPEEIVRQGDIRNVLS